jgi:plasmid stabilization system protein ParE
MVNKKREIVWTKRACTALVAAFEYIQNHSIANADKFLTEINSMVREIPNHPEIYRPDKFKRNNDGRFRAFEKYSYRIAYMITDSEIVILRIRHVKQEPQEY